MVGNREYVRLKTVGHSFATEWPIIAVDAKLKEGGSLSLSTLTEQSVITQL